MGVKYVADRTKSTTVTLKLSSIFGFLRGIKSFKFRRCYAIKSTSKTTEKLSFANQKMFLDTMPVNISESERLCNLYQYYSCDLRAFRMVSDCQQRRSNCVSGRYPVRELRFFCEPLIALISATVTTAYTIHHERRRVGRP